MNSLEILMFDDKKLRLAYNDALSFNAKITKSPLTDSFMSFPCLQSVLLISSRCLAAPETTVSCLIVCLLKIMFCQIISMLANRI